MLNTIAGLELVGKITDHLTDLAGRQLRDHNADSLIQVSQPARVEPITLIDQRAQQLPYITDVMNSLSSIFSGYYMQAVSLLCNVGSVNVIKLLDRLSPSRLGWTDQVFAKLGGNRPSMEMMAPLLLPDFRQPDLGFESADVGEAVKGAMQNAKDLATEETGSKGFRIGVSKDLNPAINESVNLSVGKMLEVKIDSNGSSAVFPISVRLLATIIDPQSLVHILSDGSSATNSFMERIHAWRAGDKRFWADLILCQDLIAEHRKALMNDKSNVYADMLARRKNNSRAALISGEPSVATASNLVVITQESAKELERRIGGQLKDFAVRKRVFDSTYVMIMAVIDPEWEHITFYSNGISTPIKLSINQLKTSNKGTGPDVMDILKAFQLGSAPSF